MGTSWRNTTLGDFVSLQRGHDLTEGERRPGHIPVMGSAGMNGHHDTAKAKGPGVVVGRSGASFGQVHFCGSDYWPHNTALYVTDFHGNDSRFVYFFLKSIDFSRYNSGSAQASLNRNFIYPIPICVPEPNEQRAIASILGSLDDKIELNRRMNETLESLAQTLFKSWFIDPTRNGLPKGWRKVRLDHLCEIGRGSSPRPIHDFMGGEVPWIKIADATASAGPFIYQTREFVTKKGSEHSVWVHPGDLILSNSATCGVPNFVDLPGCIHDGWLYFKNLKCISKYYLFHVLKAISDHLVHIADGSVQKNLNTALVGGQMILVPDEKALNAFDAAVVPMFERILRNGRESRTLAALRDSLLPRLLSGELRVDTMTIIKHECAYT